MAVWIQHCFTVYTSTNIVHFTVNTCEVQTPLIQDVNGLYSVQSAAVQAFIISASVMYMDVCMQHGGMIYVHGNI